METFVKYMGIAVVVLLIAIGLATLSAWFVMLMVNYLFTPAVLTAVFGVAKIGFWKAWVLSFLTATLFKATSTK